jgi:Caspase domain
MRRALCVGIDGYSFGDLTGCVSDAEHLAAVLRRHDDGSPNFDVRELKAPSGSTAVVTRSALREAIGDLFKHPADLALLSFSGHGAENDLGGYLVTQDARPFDPGVWMMEVIDMANRSKSDEVVILLDCCHSGHLGNMPVVDNTKAMLREGVSILTASRGTQVSVEVGGGGVFTSLVVDALSGGAADILGNVSAAGIYAFVEAALGAWDQRPLFKAHAAQVIPLRRCVPAVDIVIIRELPLLFPLPAEDFPLTPEYERSSQTKDDAKVLIMDKLQALNRVHLVVPVDSPHMFDAAMQTKACRLTAAGRYYWRLAKDERI